MKFCVIGRLWTRNGCSNFGRDRECITNIFLVRQRQRGETTVAADAEVFDLVALLLFTAAAAAAAAAGFDDASSVT